MDKKTKDFKGKAIYNPKGKAKEYSLWAANFYKGCEGDCSYCYLKDGLFVSNWSNKPILKTSLIDEDNAVKIFRKEMKTNLKSLRENGLFFNFSSDPCLKDTFKLNWECIDYALFSDVPVIVLTKQTWWINTLIESEYYSSLGKELKIGFTLTNHDHLEPGCALHIERMEALRRLKKAGYYTWASIEPVIDVNISTFIITELLKNKYSDHIKIGLKSRTKYDPYKLRIMIRVVNALAASYGGTTIYWKESILNKAGVKRESLPDYCTKAF